MENKSPQWAKSSNERLKALEKDSHPPTNWEDRIVKMEDTWKELYHKLVLEFHEVKKEVDLLRTILHTYLPIIEENNDDMEGTI